TVFLVTVTYLCKAAGQGCSAIFSREKDTKDKILMPGCLDFQCQDPRKSTYRDKPFENGDSKDSRQMLM
ncbi:hypothetical protein ACQP3F_31710, partial [Escherichia coli]